MSDSPSAAQAPFGHDTLVIPVQLPAGLVGRARGKASPAYRSGSANMSGSPADPRRSIAPTPRRAPGRDAAPSPE